MQNGRRGCGQPLLPVSIRGEVPGRAMRGSAGVRKGDGALKPNPFAGSMLARSLKFAHHRAVDSA
ncbi:MAG: hypothetical protein E5V40_24035 [Mesorhizobium sp.]|nr:MAG: hypothetical protein E5V40_24035 [Mesorhizobium sp.]